MAITPRTDRTFTHGTVVYPGGLANTPGMTPIEEATRSAHGIDIPIKAGRPIVVPEAGVVRVVEPGDRGMRVTIRGNATGLYHVIDGFDPARWDWDGRPGTTVPPTIGLSVNQFQTIGYAAGKGVIWEVRRKLAPDAGEDLADLAVDPVRLVNDDRETDLAPAASSGGGLGLLLILVGAILIMGDDR